MPSAVDQEKMQRLREAVAPYLNRPGPAILSRCEITLPENWNFLQAVEDANPVYWDEEFAKQSRFGRIISPPQMIWTVFMDHWWAPSYVREAIRRRTGGHDDPPAKVQELLRTVGGYTTGVNASREDVFLEPYGPGDGRLKASTVVSEISDEKQTAVGRGVFVTTTIEYRREKDDRLVVRAKNVLLHYNPDPPQQDQAKEAG